MMEPFASPERHETSPSASHTATDAPTTTDRDMIFFRRPDLNARQLFFHGNSPRRRGDSENAIPVQLVGVDGRTHIGMPASAARARPYTEVTVDTQDAQQRSRDSRLSRLVVMSDVLGDASTKRRLRHMKFLFVGMAIGNGILTTSLLFPRDSDAWFYVDGFGSTVGPLHLQRLKLNSLALLILSLGCNAVGIAAVLVQKASALTLFIFATVVSDVWTLTMLLPHPFFLLRLLFDVLYILFASEYRSYLTQPWFVTNFHRLRY